MQICSTLKAACSANQPRQSRRTRRPNNRAAGGSENENGGGRNAIPFWPERAEGLHATDPSNRRSRSAANTKQARTSSIASSGKSRTISASVMPEARYSRMSVTVIRSPRTHGLPLRLPGSTVIRFKSSDDIEDSPKNLTMTGRDRRPHHLHQTSRGDRT